ncbi:15523_t:CDS:2 [Gigaspora rosea]|nr:15523_t:CDS:2 [Gigaspora rosea]
MEEIIDFKKMFSASENWVFVRDENKTPRLLTSFFNTDNGSSAGKVERRERDMKTEDLR